MAIGLRVEGFEVLEALSGPEALEGTALESVDAAVVDLMMPVMNGLEVCRILQDKFPETVVVLTSAYHLSRRQIELARVGDVTFLGKPFPMEKLANLLRGRLAELEKVS
jgi:DNA-binding response OmpR family regulator